MKTLKTTIFFTFIVTAVFLLQGCVLNGVNSVKGDGVVVMKHYDIAGFSELNLGGTFNVIIEEGDKVSLKIETDENLHQYLNAEMENEVLNIYSDRDVVLRPTKINVYVTYTNIERIHSAGACKITGKSTIQSDIFTINISGAGSGDLNVETNKLKTDVSGAASITLSGSAISHKAVLSGASSLKAEELITEETIISLSGAGAATVYATEVLDASLSGVGSINYAGNPTRKNTNVSGIGRISSKD